MKGFIVLRGSAKSGQRLFHFWTVATDSGQLKADGACRVVSCRLLRHSSRFNFASTPRLRVEGDKKKLNELQKAKSPDLPALYEHVSHQQKSSALRPLDISKTGLGSGRRCLMRGKEGGEGGDVLWLK